MLLKRKHLAEMKSSLYANETNISLVCGIFFLFVYVIIYNSFSISVFSENRKPEWIRFHLAMPIGSKPRITKEINNDKNIIY